MGFWNKLGQIALQAAPYLAAPLTGGMSLMAAPMTGNLANRLEDKADRETFEKTGVAPSRNMMNKIMGGVNMAAGAYGGAKVGSRLGGGNTPVMSDGGPGGMTGNVGSGGLGDFAKQFMNQQLGGGFNLGGMFGGAPQQPQAPPPQAGPVVLPNTGGAEIARPNLGAAVARGRNQARGIGPRM